MYISTVHAVRIKFYYSCITVIAVNKLLRTAVLANIDNHNGHKSSYIQVGNIMKYSTISSSVAPKPY